MRETAASAIGEIFRDTGKETEALEQLKSLLKDEDSVVKREITLVIGEMFSRTGSKEVLELLKPLLKDEDRIVRGVVAEAIKLINSC